MSIRRHMLNMEWFRSSLQYYRLLFDQRVCNNSIIIITTSLDPLHWDHEKVNIIKGVLKYMNIKTSAISNQSNVYINDI